MIRVARKYHKWLMAFVGIQFLFWSATGLYMVSLDIHFIHGESMENRDEGRIQLSSVAYPVDKLMANYPDATNLELKTLLARPVYQFRDGATNTRVILDAETGERLANIDEATAAQIALRAYKGKAPIESIRLIPSRETLPAELSPRHLPAWQVKFDHFSTPTFYISQQTGALVTKRHMYWRLFDWMWRFHIMDYDDGENVSNWFLLLVAVMGVLAALTGAVLTYFRIAKPQSLEAN